VEDLLAVPGMTPKMVAMLKDYVVILPRATPLNVNTAPVELIAARIDGLTSSDAVAIVSARQQAYFRDGNDFVQRFPGKPLSPALGDISVSSNFFIVSGRVRLNRGTLEVDSLVERNKDDVRVIWVRDS
jgi:general secretion pathway protein K